MDNVYKKLQRIRVELQNCNLKKSGHNKFANFKYFELADFLPTVNFLMDKHNLSSALKIEEGQAILTVINSEKPEEKIEFTCPRAELNLKGANSIQNLGGEITYYRRYLYMNALEIIESDFFDPVLGKEEKKTKISKNKVIIMAKSKGIEAKTLGFICERDYKKTLDELNQDELNEFYEKLEEFEGTKQ